MDTNIYIAATKIGGLSHEIVQAVLNKESGFLVFISPEIFSELEERLKELEKEKWLTNQRASIVLDAVQGTARIVYPMEKINIVKEDPDDNKILECAVAAEANLIVTMDKDLLRLKIFRNIPIIHPNTFKYIMPRR